VQRGLTQTELAARAGTTQAQISRWETAAGVPLGASVLSLAQALCVSADYLLGLEDAGGEP